MEELICGRNNFVFNVFLHLEPVQRSRNMVSIGATTARARAFWIEGELTAI